MNYDNQTERFGNQMVSFLDLAGQKHHIFWWEKYCLLFGDEHICSSFCAQQIASADNSNQCLQVVGNNQHPLGHVRPVIYHKFSGKSNDTIFGARQQETWTRSSFYTVCYRIIKAWKNFMISFNFLLYNQPVTLLWYSVFIVLISSHALKLRPTLPSL